MDPLAVINPINVLQTCINRSVKQAYFLINYSPTRCQIQYGDACIHFEIPSSLTEKHESFEIDSTCGHK